MAVRHSLRLIRGKTFRIRFLYKDESSGVAIDLTNYTLALSIGVGTETLSLTEGSGLTITPLLGQIDVLITSTQSNFTSSKGDYILTATDDSQPVGKGDWVVSYGPVEVYNLKEPS